MKTLLKLLQIILLLAGGLVIGFYISPKTTPESPISQIKPRPLDKYTIENLAKTDVPEAQIEIGEPLVKEEKFTSSLFSMSFDPSLSGKEKKKVTGLINVPTAPGLFPLVVMFRGYVDQKLYQTGDGTRRAAEFFAQNGLMTIAPDFLGYGGSDAEAGSIFESRFQTYTTALVLLNSLNSIPGWDGTNVVIWGHSNGGQIAMTVLEITGRAIPTTLWAPVSKPFPYSILYYTDESEDRGKLIRRELAAFEETYDPDRYAIDLYYERVKAPLIIHQGTFDDAVPKQWSDELTKKLDELEIDFDYFVYPGADHNLNPLWGTVIARDLAFFNKQLE
ncbi:MAG: Peptidase [Candidatus Woesebacteria bacterium GW2011_GWC2_45_9]|uniref:Peptidase n=1 Tax=Candidatus Woesebacteria bacterium GW2011_GWC2_45_9 TaxID=1618589 RepID=A0A0G1N993_9BACT|nr:MAG: Peptidase [Candidatus Woesebacteria bacterium GW2011_GWC2_45_9]